MMHILETIEKKSRGLALTTQEIEHFVRDFTNGAIPDYQASALLMAIRLKGMDERETADLTYAMMRSGRVLELSIEGVPVADKHSTGGVGDTTSLVLVPLCASLGVPMAKMSGRGLGHTGGTIDKLEAIPGFQTQLSMERIRRQLLEIGAVMVAQSEQLAPADKKMYALRDATATVYSRELIASSIMSKKLALGTQIIALDVKTGSGAFMQTPGEAFALAQTMVDIGTRLGRKVEAVVTGMDQPLGNMVGNALDVREAIEVLQGMHMQSDLYRVIQALGVLLLRMAGKAQAEEEARQMLCEAVQSGAALTSFARLIAAQGGDARVCEEPAIFGQARHIVPVLAEKEGVVAAMDAAQIGLAAKGLGAGRTRLGDAVDPLVGLEMQVRLGEKVRKGDALCLLHANDVALVQPASKRVIGAIQIDDEATAPTLIYGTVAAGGNVTRSFGA